MLLLKYYLSESKGPHVRILLYFVVVKVNQRNSNRVKVLKFLILDI